MRTLHIEIRVSDNAMLQFERYFGDLQAIDAFCKDQLGQVLYDKLDEIQKEAYQFLEEEI